MKRDSQLTATTKTRMRHKNVQQTKLYIWICQAKFKALKFSISFFSAVKGYKDKGIKNEISH